MYIFGAKFEKHCFNIPEIFFIQYFTILVANNMTHHFPDLHNTKTSISLKRKDVTKTGNGEWGMGNGEWGMGNGEWGMGNGEWGMGNGKWEIEFFFTKTANGEWEIERRN